MTLDDLLKLADMPRRVEPVPVGDSIAYVRSLSMAEVNEAADAAGEDDVRPYLLARALCDAEGKPLCGATNEYADRFVNLPAALARRLFAAIDRASDVPPGALVAAAKNCETRTAGGGTGSAAS